MTGATGDAARAYLERGWAVVPVRPRDKRPIVAWQRFQEEAPTAAEVAGWYERWPDANVGIVTGAVSGLVVIDVDPAHGGSASLEKLERERGPLRSTVEAVSGGGGRHLYFAHPGGTVRNRVGLLPGIDLRGDGGLIVAPPSVHPSGKRYEWVRGRGPGELELAPLPGFFLEQLADRPLHSPTYWRELMSTGVTEGSRNATIASLTGHLLWHGLGVEEITELLLCWNRARCRPPLPDSEVVRTVESIRRTHQRGRPSR